MSDIVEHKEHAQEELLEAAKAALFVLETNKDHLSIPEKQIGESLRLAIEKVEHR